MIFQRGRGRAKASQKVGNSSTRVQPSQGEVKGKRKGEEIQVETHTKENSSGNLVIQKSTTSTTQVGKELTTKRQKSSVPEGPEIVQKVTSNDGEAEKEDPKEQLNDA